MRLLQLATSGSLVRDLHRRGKGSHESRLALFTPFSPSPSSQVTFDGLSPSLRSVLSAADMSRRCLGVRLSASLRFEVTSVARLSSLTPILHAWLRMSTARPSLASVLRFRGLGAAHWS